MNLFLTETEEIKFALKDTAANFKTLRGCIKAVKDILQTKPVPYATKKECLNELEVLDKQAILGLRFAARKLIISEIENVVQKANKTSAAFIVHLFRTPDPIEFKLLTEARERCGNLPTILLVQSGKTVAGCARVPEQYLMDGFNSEIWLHQLGDEIRSCINKSHLKDGYSICNLPKFSFKSDKFDLDQAVNQIIKYAEKFLIKK